MKIVCDRLLLNNALSGVSKAVATSSALPIIEGILIECRDGVMTLTGYDLEMGIITSIPVQHEQDCRLVVRAKLLQDTKERLTKILASNTGQDYDKVYQDTDRDNFMTAEEALQYGLIDKIYYNRG